MRDRKTKGEIPKGDAAKCGKANLGVKIKEHVDQKGSVLSCSKNLHLNKLSRSKVTSRFLSIAGGKDWRQTTKEASYPIRMEKCVGVNGAKLSLLLSSAVLV